ncbi:metal ABC transporter substrate-binding protein [Halopiger djelfimassiliensis]|uniref:metal ABC transporter substrate-binding protein n=1 Tax=Halopiger djelfimassiliensis TaxID=1293047 RepID=UPI000677AF86|nr:zinc ABC transporter substrate-binding protein [Halopiger djelfimassiliensis]
MNLSRRTFLQGSAGSVAVGSLAGCLDGVARTGEGVDSGYAAFFALWDWTQHVTGDEASFENPVGAGEMGHGWEPDGTLVTDIASTDAFVYLDLPEFSWAQDVATTLEADYETVAVIDGLEGLDDELLDWDHDHGHNDHDDHGHNDHDDHGDHDRGNVDPHVWVDPVLAREIVTTIADELGAAAPDSAETFEDNAAAYNDRLETLDERFRTLVDEAERDVAVLAGHNSYKYLQHRYGFEIHTPTGVSPQDEPDFDALSSTIELVDDRGIETILYDRFEVAGEDDLPRQARTILEGSSATDAMPVTPAEGTLKTWQQNDWGYLEQMEEINIPAFREALGAQ